MSSMRDKVAALSAKLSGKKQKRGGGESTTSKRAKTADPSARYLAHPLTAPIVQRWHAYFRTKLDAPPRVFVGPKVGWRGLAKLAARRVDGKVLLGLFAPGSHDVLTSASKSAAHAPALNRAIRAVEDALADERIYVNGAAEGDGSISYVGFAHASTADTVQVVVVVNGESDAAARRVLAKLDASRLHSCFAHLNPVSQHDNAIYGRGGPETWRRLLPVGEDRGYKCGACVVEKPLGVALSFAPACFRQANLLQFAEIIKATQRAVPRKSRIVELYGGVATIGAHLLEHAVSVRCSDENPWNAACVELLKRDLPAALAGKLSYETLSAAACAKRGDLRDADVVIVDPPRKGLCADVLKALLRPAPKKRRLVYVSCGFDAFQRDLMALLAGRWRLDHVEGHVLFPGADHIETLAIFREVAPDR